MIFKLLIQTFEVLIEKYKPTPSFFDTKKFSIVNDIAKCKKEIVKEFNKVRSIKFNNISPETAPDKYFKNANWKVFILMAYGKSVVENCMKCPKTYEILKKHKNIKTAMFSVLPPDSSMNLHRGPYKGVLRCLYKLKLNKTNKSVGLFVRDQEIDWKSTECVIFDDTLPHAAWNYSDKDRVVLFLDLVRPLPWHLHLFNILFLYLIGNSKRVKSIYDFYKKQNNLKD